MSKIFYFLFFSFLALTITSCDNESSTCSIDYDGFLQGLMDHHKKMSDIMVQTGTRSEFPDDSLYNNPDLLETAENIDSEMQTFYKENEAYLLTYAPNVNLSQDDIELMSMDQDTLVAYINDNFSERFTELAEGILTNSISINIEQIVADNTLNPLEQTILSDLITCEEFQLAMWNKTTTPDDDVLQGGENSTYAECADQFRSDLQYCDDQLFLQGLTIWAGTLVGGSAGTVVLPLVGSISGAAAGGIITGVGALANYVLCVNKSNSDYKQCKKNAHK